MCTNNYYLGGGGGGGGESSIQLAYDVSIAQPFGAKCKMAVASIANGCMQMQSSSCSITTHSTVGCWAEEKLLFRSSQDISGHSFK